MTTSLRAWMVCGAVLAFGLGCSGLMGYGEEVASAPVTSGQPFELTAPASDAPLKLWLSYEVEYQGGDYEVAGKIDHWTDKRDRASMQVHVREDGAPVDGQPRVSLNKMHTEAGGSGRMKETLRLSELPASGKPRKVKGTLGAGSGTSLQSARLVVTR